MAGTEPSGNGSAAAETVLQMLLRHDSELRDLERWRNEFRGAFGLIRFAFGTSIVSAIATILAIVSLTSGGK